MVPSLYELYNYLLSPIAYLTMLISVLRDFSMISHNLDLVTLLRSTKVKVTVKVAHTRLTSVGFRS